MRNDGDWSTPRDRNCYEFISCCTCCRVMKVVREDWQARKLNKEDAVDRCKWRKVIKEAR